MIMSFVCCNRNPQTQSRNENRASTPADSSVEDTTDHYMEFVTLSDKDLWLRVAPSSLKSDISKRLVDVYNASVVQNSIMTDFDLQMRGYDLNDVIKAIESIDVTRVKDAEVLNKLNAYKREMLYL